MKVLRLIQTFYPHVTGPIYQSYRISKGLTKRGHVSPILTSDHVPPDESKGHPPDMAPGESFSFEVRRRKMVASVDQYRITPGVLLDSVSEDYDIVHAHGYRNPLKDVFYPVAKVLRRKPLVVHAHGTLGGYERDPSIQRNIQYRLYDRFFKQTVKNADAVVVSTEQERDEAETFGVPSTHIHVIPVGKDPDVYTSVPHNPPDDQFRLLFVGRLAPRRNVEMLLNAATQLEDVHIRVVGGKSSLSGAEETGYLKKLRDVVNKYGISDRVTFTGAKYGDELIEEFRSAHAFVNPSHYENFGQASLEAAFAGLPLIATPTGVAPEFIDAGGGIQVESVDDLVAAISHYVESPSRSEVHGETARQFAMEQYRWEHIIDQYEDLYESLI